MEMSVFITVIVARSSSTTRGRHLRINVIYGCCSLKEITLYMLKYMRYKNKNVQFWTLR